MMAMRAAAVRGEAMDEVVVTGARIEAQLEALGDLKLYRVPFRSTVAAKGQKQVKLLGKQNVPARLVYRGNAEGSGEAPEPLEIEVRMDNETATGLGLPLPSGRISVFEGSADNGLLIGEGRMRDYAVGQEVKFTIGQSNAVQLSSTHVKVATKDGWDGYRLKLTNANPAPVTAEIDLASIADSQMRKSTGRTIRKDGNHVWRVTIPANDTATLGYEVRELNR